MEARFNPELVLEHTDRAAVAQTIGTPGYTVIHRLMRSEVDKFIVGLINVDESDDRAVIASHKLAKAAAQFYQAMTNRINHEVSLYMAAVQGGGEPIDPTEGLLEMGAPASTFNDLDSDQLLEEESE